MRTCHFQDRPGRDGFCLRLLLDGSKKEDGLPNFLRHCTDERAENCAHRGWDPEIRTRCTQARSGFLGSCGACGGKHDDLQALLMCLTDTRLELVLKPCPGWDPDGSEEPLLDRQTPTRLRHRAWRKVREAVLSRDGWVCQDCGKDLTRYPSWYREVHHIRARVDGGSDHPRNLKTLCLECHGRYTDAMASERVLLRNWRGPDQALGTRYTLLDFDDDR